MKKLVFYILIISIFQFCQPDENAKDKSTLQDSIITLNNSKISLTVDLHGGEYIDMHLVDKPINPFTWHLLPEEMPENNKPYAFEGHFLCTGRWGSPSEGEIEVGIPHNGEVNTQKWLVDSLIESENYKIITMHCKAPVEKLDVARKIIMSYNGSYFIVQESFQNNLPIGRPSNVVQHSTIGRPFLSESTLINTNAIRGFDQRTNYKHLEDSSFIWPDGHLADGTIINLKQVTHPEDYVTSHIFEDNTGWITAFNRDENIILGYAWNTKEYPWVNIWHKMKNGKPFAQGLEFGTTGLGQPYELLLENNVSFYGRNSFEYIDAGEIIQKSWVCFILEVSNNFKQVSELEINDNEIVIKDNSSGETIIIPGTYSAILEM